MFTSEVVKHRDNMDVCYLLTGYDLAKECYLATILNMGQCGEPYSMNLTTEIPFDSILEGNWVRLGINTGGDLRTAEWEPI